MKSKTFWMALLAATTFGATAQKMKAGKVPATVTAAFAQAYPNATDIHWEKEKSGDYEVEFELDQVEMSVVYDAQGLEKEVETEIAVSELPAAVQTALKGKRIKEAAKITKSGMTYYEAEVKRKDLMFDASGKALDQ